MFFALLIVVLSLFVPGFPWQFVVLACCAGLEAFVEIVAVFDG